ncbi:solute carrier family 46 member 3-like isoform X2 [Sitodiplosis mosellana]|nr:solute carrier family 46 member 3-like isoform X2 [Sitodiplosis mosellana]
MVEQKTETNKKNETLFKEMTFGKKIQYIYDHITLEPMVACFVLPSMLLMLGVQNLNLEKACRVNLNYNQTVCDALRVRDTAHYADEEVAIQKLVATMTGWKMAINSAVPCLLILFFGSWSDRHGKRKPCILIPLCGQIMMAFSLLLCVYFDKTPIEVAIFVEVFFPCITGSHFTMMVGIFSYMADITKEKERTVRIGIISLVYSVGVPFGMAFSGILLKRVGFYGVFSMAGTLYTTALLYGLFVLKEVPPKEMNEQLIKKSFLADFFDFGHIKETFLVAFKARVKNRRMKILALMAVVIIVVGPQHGEMSLFYLFTRYKFNWSEVEFSFFSTYNMGIHLIGTGFAVSVLSSMFKVDDALIGSMASFSKILSSFVYAFSQVEWHMFIGPVAEIIGGAAFIAMRSLASKIVSSNELGKINSLFGIVESIAPLIYSPVLAAIYSATLTKMPGAFFLVGGIMTIPGVMLFIWIYTINRAEAKEKTAADNTPVDVQKAVEEKQCEMYLQNEGLSVISDIKGL